MSRVTCVHPGSPRLGEPWVTHLEKVPKRLKPNPTFSPSPPSMRKWSSFNDDTIHGSAMMPQCLMAPCQSARPLYRGSAPPLERFPSCSPHLPLSALPHVNLPRQTHSSRKTSSSTLQSLLRNGPPAQDPDRPSQARSRERLRRQRDFRRRRRDPLAYDGWQRGCIQGGIGDLGRVSLMTLSHMALKDRAHASLSFAQ